MECEEYYTVAFAFAFVFIFEHWIRPMPALGHQQYVCVCDQICSTAPFYSITGILIMYFRGCCGLAEHRINSETLSYSNLVLFEVCSNEVESCGVCLTKNIFHRDWTQANKWMDFWLNLFSGVLYNYKTKREEGCMWWKCYSCDSFILFSNANRGQKKKLNKSLRWRSCLSYKLIQNIFSLMTCRHVYFWSLSNRANMVICGFHSSLYISMDLQF